MLAVSFAIISMMRYANAETNCSSIDATKNCVDGILIPILRPFLDLTTVQRITRGFIFFLMIAYCFLGVSIVADRFMSSIEVITSKERTITVKKKGLTPMKIKVRIWNETVSNLTLMALGSSAPEILLSIIEVVGKRFQAGDLGPNTIVGSAAFNLFMIIAICVVAVPSNEIRRQKHLDVFFVTATWSLFAYVWLYIMLAVISPGIIEIWEGLVTFAFFPITVLTAWVADVKIIQKRFLPRRYRSSARGIIVSEGEELRAIESNGNFKDPSIDPIIKAFEDNREKFILIMRELRKKNPQLDPSELQKLAEYELINQGPKSRAFYRVQATRKLVGGGDIIRSRVDKQYDAMQLTQEQEFEESEQLCKISFDPAHYTVVENIGSFDVTVVRKGDTADNLTLLIDYFTEDGTANANADYVPVEGTLTFQPGDSKQTIRLEIIDDDVFEEDEHFYLHLTNLRVRTANGIVVGPSGINSSQPVAELQMPFTAIIMILDDDHAGVFSFEKDTYNAIENCGCLSLKVKRSSGCRGKVIIPYRVVDGTAISGMHYFGNDGEIVFEDNQTEAYIEVGIYDTEQYERTDYFSVELLPPVWIKKMSDIQGKNQNFLTSEQIEVAELGKPRLGDHKTCQIIIKESKEFQNVIDRMLKTANISLILGTSSWREQFFEALTVSGGEKDGEAGTMGNTPGCFDYIMHFISVPWKLLFATIPPTDYWDGWACFIVSIALIGMLTALIGDLASQFGCWVGLKDAVTAISFVALGTSVPDLFASKVAAIQDKYADSSIGNVTGSNAVNVFLGIGLAWTLAAVYQWYQGSVFRVDPGTLAFSLTVFCVEALLCISIIILRRHPMVGGELGGPFKFKVLTSGFFIILWLIYIGLSSLVSYCIISGF